MSQFEPGVSVVLLARNEAKRLPQWFEVIAPWAEEIIVVDSGSTDQTSEIARRFTDKVYPITNKLNFDINKNYAFSLATRAWILSLDADEIPTPDLIADLRAKVYDTNCHLEGFNVMILHYALGEIIQPPTKHLRLFRNGLGSFPGERIHQAITVSGEVATLKGHIDHHTYNSIYERIEKTNLYSESMAAHWYHSGQRFRVRDMIWQPLKHFLKVYFYRGSYKRGVLGLFSALDGSYSVFLRYVKLWSAYKLGHFPAPSDEFPPQEH